MATWRERIVAARELGAFMPDDYRDATRWVSCKVGEEETKYPGLIVRVEDILEPSDQALFELGEHFPERVRANDFAGAERVIDAIEDRVLQLKRESGVGG